MTFLGDLYANNFLSLYCKHTGPGRSPSPVDGEVTGQEYVLDKTNHSCDKAQSSFLLVRTPDHLYNHSATQVVFPGFLPFLFL